MKDTRFKCPQCHNLLQIDTLEDEFGDLVGYDVYCSYGPCKSDACADGAKAKSVEGAVDEVLEKWADEQVEKDGLDSSEDPC